MKEMGAKSVKIVLSNMLAELITVNSVHETTSVFDYNEYSSSVHYLGPVRDHHRLIGTKTRYVSGAPDYYKRKLR